MFGRSSLDGFPQNILALKLYALSCLGTKRSTVAKCHSKVPNRAHDNFWPDIKEKENNIGAVNHHKAKHTLFILISVTKVYLILCWSQIYRQIEKYKERKGDKPGACMHTRRDRKNGSNNVLHSLTFNIWLAKTSDGHIPGVQVSSFLHSRIHIVMRIFMA